jgi:hypothetical protein
MCEAETIHGTSSGPCTFDTVEAALTCMEANQCQGFSLEADSCMRANCAESYKCFYQCLLEPYLTSGSPLGACLTLTNPGTCVAVTPTTTGAATASTGKQDSAGAVVQASLVTLTVAVGVLAAH